MFEVFLDAELTWAKRILFSVGGCSGGFVLRQPTFNESVVFFAYLNVVLEVAFSLGLGFFEAS